MHPTGKHLLRLFGAPGAKAVRESQAAAAEAESKLEAAAVAQRASDADYARQIAELRSKLDALLAAGAKKFDEKRKALQKKFDEHLTAELNARADGEEKCVDRAVKQRMAAHSADEKRKLKAACTDRARQLEQAGRELQSQLESVQAASATEIRSLLTKLGIAQKLLWSRGKTFWTDLAQKTFWAFRNWSGVSSHIAYHLLAASFP